MWLEMVTDNMWDVVKELRLVYLNFSVVEQSISVHYF